MLYTFIDDDCNTSLHCQSASKDFLFDFDKIIDENLNSPTIHYGVKNNKTIKYFTITFCYKGLNLLKIEIYGYLYSALKRHSLTIESLEEDLQSEKYYRDPLWVRPNRLCTCRL